MILEGHVRNGVIARTMQYNSQKEHWSVSKSWQMNRQQSHQHDAKGDSMPAKYGWPQILTNGRAICRSHWE
jgi:hypothetical protein